MSSGTEKSSGSISESESSLYDSSAISLESSSDDTSSDASSSDYASSDSITGSEDESSSSSSGSSSGSGSSSEVNPFGLLTIRYVWVTYPDLDSGTTFRENTVGYGWGASADYMNRTGDVMAAGGTEVVTIDLAAAFDDGAIDTPLGAEIECAADWFPFADLDLDTEPNPDPGTGPASLQISYMGANDAYLINPGSATPSSTNVASIIINADGTYDITFP